MTNRLLDLFCGAGGAAVGYHRAGFDVVGVDIEAQPNYPFEFFQGDALEWDDFNFDAIHASPPCQHYANVTRWRGETRDHPALIAPTRRLLQTTELPWVIENVRTLEVRADFMLCGTSLGLPIRRHRHFETNWSDLVMSHPCGHSPADLPFEHKQERAYADAMGCDWMTYREAREAIPPAYTELIGAQLLAYIEQKAGSDD